MARAMFYNMVYFRESYNHDFDKLLVHDIIWFDYCPINQKAHLHDDDNIQHDNTYSCAMIWYILSDV